MRTIRISSILFFLLVHLHYFWIKWLPMPWDSLLTLVLIAAFFVFSIILLFQIGILIKEKLEHSNRIISVTLVFILLALTAIFPNGLIDFEKLEEPDLLTARFKGTMVTRTIRLKPDNRFLFSVSSWGLDEYPGRYQIRGDTIKLEYDRPTPDGDLQAYGVLYLAASQRQLVYYRNYNAKRNYPFHILKCELEQCKQQAK